MAENHGATQVTAWWIRCQGEQVKLNEKLFSKKLKIRMENNSLDVVERRN